MAGTASVRAPKRLDTSVVCPRGSALLGLGRVGGGAPSVLLSPWHKAVARDVQRGQWPCIAHTWARRARAFYACALRASITFIFLYPEQAEDAMARQSYWLTSMALPRFPKLRKDVTVDVVIIGGALPALPPLTYSKRRGARWPCWNATAVPAWTLVILPLQRHLSLT
jgi:hypothetical protein